MSCGRSSSPQLRGEQVRNVQRRISMRNSSEHLIAAAAAGSAKKEQATATSAPLKRCRPAHRLVRTVSNPAEFDSLRHAVTIYGWNRFGSGLVEACRQTRHVITMQNRGGWRPKPDPLFDYLYTRFRGRWHLTLLQSVRGHPFRLKVVFKEHQDAAAFLETWDRGVCPLRATEIDKIIQWPI